MRTDGGTTSEAFRSRLLLLLCARAVRLLLLHSPYRELVCNHVKELSWPFERSFAFGLRPSLQYVLRYLVSNPMFTPAKYTLAAAAASVRWSIPSFESLVRNLGSSYCAMLM